MCWRARGGADCLQYIDAVERSALRRPNLYYADPAEMLSYCLTRFGRSVALLQDYGLWEFTVLVRYPPASAV